MARAAYFLLIVGHLYKVGPDEILYRCLLKHERPMILNEPHATVIGGHYTRKDTLRKILQEGLWWASLHVDAREYCHNCDICQRTGKPSRWDEMSLVPQINL